MTPRPYVAATRLAPLAALAAFACATGDTGVIPIDDPRSFPVHEISVSGPVEYRARTERPAGEGTLRAILEVENPGADPVRVFHGACALGVRAYREASRVEPAVWDNHLRDAVACIEILYGFTVEPGATGELVEDVDLDLTELRLPRGLLHFSLVIRQDGQLVRIPAGSLTIP